MSTWVHLYRLAAPTPQLEWR